VSERYLHFTIGPVQGFVAQSRRTRDLLASSFLLSYLSGHAMMAVIQAGGEIVFPYVQKKNQSDGSSVICHSLLLEISRLLAGNEPKEQLWMGSLPNRFKAKIPATFDPKQCVEAVHRHWIKVAEAVWDYIMPGMEKYREETRKIWDRQVNGFWEISWVIGEEADLLDRRKNWRNHIPTEEAGDKCTLISNLQEISGHFRSAEQKQFWDLLQKKLDPYDLAPNERLSAIGLIKRIFPLVAKQAIGWEFPNEVRYFPSVTYLSAFPWVLRAVREQEERAAYFAEEAKKYGIRIADREKIFPALKDLKQKALLYQFANLEGSTFFGDWDKSSEKDDTSLGQAYSELINKMGGEPTPYYAILLMDGDQLGRIVSSYGAKVSQALSTFSDELNKVVKKHNGVTVYAGGDDVLVLLPFDQALSVAVQLRENYLNAFSEIKGDLEKGKEELEATISAAVLYAHYYAPLKNVLQHAHYLLDKVAKEQSGRDSLAVAIWKRSGPDWQWVSKWEKVYDEGSLTTETILEKLARQFSKDKENLLSGSFLYKWRECYEQTSFSQDKEVLTDLIVADYLRIKEEKTAAAQQEAKNQIKELVDLCFASGTFSTNGALLVRFLGQKGGGRT
jgi:CRISPR-associated protein Cmr2